MPVPSFCGISAVPMKLPAWMASGATAFITATLQDGARPTLVGAPLAGFTVTELASIAVTTPRTTIGAAGAWARAAPAASVTAATIVAAVFNMPVFSCSRLRAAP